jgi:hypothetical protein
MSAGPELVEVAPNERGGVVPEPITPALRAKLADQPGQRQRILDLVARKTNRVYGARGAEGGGNARLGPDRKGAAR